VPVAIGVLAKETAVMLPLYAVLIEWALFGFRKASAYPRANSWMTDARTLVGRALPAGSSGAGLSGVAAGGARPT
ncbi:hypothetical protein, partial [Klebsiella pneumoniae]|uniref:hypothetical protein n=1 Tax=Klebsiella pneumoniae TaxID=573 RepID=UPI0025A0D066